MLLDSEGIEQVELNPDLNPDLFKLDIKKEEDLPLNASPKVQTPLTEDTLPIPLASDVIALPSLNLL
jgi:hypothetical protein